MINYSHMLEQTVAQRTARIQRLAHTDELTGLWNRRSLYTEAEKLIAQAEKTGTCLLMPDTSAQAARHLCDQIEDGLRSKTQGQVRLSCGISTCRPGGITNPDTLISGANSNKCAAKQENRKDGRGPVQAGRRRQDDVHADQKGRQSAYRYSACAIRRACSWEIVRKSAIFSAFSSGWSVS